ncbi:hypothetical protein BGZ93_006208, partial [Podila epicladia]
TNYDPAVISACNACIVKAGIAAVPSCKGLEGTTVSSGSTPTDKQKSCFCGLATNKTWRSECIGADKCPAEAIKELVMVYEAIAATPGACDSSASASANDGNRFCGASSVKVAAAGAVALAVAGALL